MTEMNWMTIKTPARLHKKEPLTVNYNKDVLYLKGALFIAALVLITFKFGSENINFIFWSCI